MPQPGSEDGRESRRDMVLAIVAGLTGVAAIAAAVIALVMFSPF